MFEDLDTIQQHTKHWLFLDSPVNLTIICTAYLVFVLYAGPKFMKNRPAYTLKKVIMGYNVFQIIVSAYLTKEILTNGPSFRDIYQCKLPDYSDSPQNLYRAKLLYYTFLLKIVELIETIFFVLRKKQNQISTLHVYHHISTAYIGYFGSKFIGCGLGCICVALNLTVHFFMYLYYLLSSFGDEKWQQSLRWYKMAITKFQIIQFLIMLTNLISALPCIDQITWIGYSFGVPNVILLLYMFVQFYIKSYSSSTKSVAPTVTTQNATRKIN